MPIEEPAFSVIVHPKGLTGPWRQEAVALVGAATEIDGQPPVEDGTAAALTAGERSPAVTVHHAKGGRPLLAGFAVVEGGQVSFVIDPYYRDPGHLAAVTLAEALVDMLEESEGTKPVTMVVNETRPEHRVFAAAAGLDRERRLYQMRRSLPLPEEMAAEGRRLSTRAFRPGVDDEAWLEVNNAAFANHPDQGGWTSADLEREIQNSSFDPSGFLLAELDGHLAGFCWTKIHSAKRVTFGEIYVIGVNPSFGREGLGRRLVCAGLEHMTHQVAPKPLTGMLYTEADNIPAVKLYVDLGFEVHHVHRVFSRS